MRSLEESRKRWDVTTRHATSLNELKKSVRLNGDDNPCISGLRSTFLLFQSTEVTGWSRVLVDSRSAYTSLREHLLRYIENPNEVGSVLDPLDDDKNSPWNTMRQDEEIRAEIYQDVQRCMPEEEYFRRPETQRMLLDILFVFCKINQDVGYRQGMHEVLAPILWAVEEDAIEYDSQKSAGSESDLIMKEILDRSYIEHDSFTILSLIMRSAKSFYELGEPDKRSGTSSTATGTPQQGASPIVERSKQIHEVYLARLDPELAKHLTDIEVLPQIFLIRWIRLLFGREFPFEDLLALWDTLFAEDPDLDLMDMVCVAMLLRIRWQLIEANYSVALMLLLKYPAPEPPYGPQSFVDDAIYLRDNFSAAGGAKIISKYGAQAPHLQSSDFRPPTPLGQGLSPKHKLSRARSPLTSPASFLQHQGGVEGLFQGAARGVIDRGERLGINQASEMLWERGQTSEGPRWSLDEGRSVPTQSRATISAMNIRNQQLARMLDKAMIDLRDVSLSKDGDKDKYVQAMDMAIAKVDFVRIYLEDSTMPLTPDSPQLGPVSSPANLPSPPPLNIAPPMVPATSTSISALIPERAPKQLMASSKLLESSSLAQSTPKDPESQPSSASSTGLIPDAPITKPTNETVEGLLARPKAPVPTRSTIAQSSFSWMLESDSPSRSPARSPPPKSSSFSKPGRKPTSGPSREKAAFLFGEDSAASNGSGSRLPSLADAEEGYNMGSIGSGKVK
ncbi:TBC1 domain family member [Lachnellula hyalina]|uniref:TBC1 domain family member n=1 Tax=Lachnellula hyalina TaxID=1316788 RepID=A0A8H8R3J8_9HELO|nr:TBC1 domain family member [Lachnellula hyalina]TVY27798.1 TBC1 domain family member [Lachnellula hyalina]